MPFLLKSTLYLSFFLTVLSSCKKKEEQSSKASGLVPSKTLLTCLNSSTDVKRERVSPWHDLLIGGFEMKQGASESDLKMLRDKIRTRWRSFSRNNDSFVMPMHEKSEFSAFFQVTLVERANGDRVFAMWPTTREADPVILNGVPVNIKGKTYTNIKSTEDLLLDPVGGHMQLAKILLLYSDMDTTGRWLGGGIKLDENGIVDSIDYTASINKLNGNKWTMPEAQKKEFKAFIEKLFGHEVKEQTPDVVDFVPKLPR